MTDSPLDATRRDQRPVDDGAATGLRELLEDFLSRHQIDGESVTAEVARVAAGRMMEVAKAGDAELTERGYRWLTVEHGDIETPEDEAAICELRRWGDRHPGAVQRTAATNDTTRWLLSPPAAEHHRASLEAVAREHNPGWWKIHHNR